MNLKPVGKDNGVTKGQRLKLSATLFALAALMLILAAVGFFVGKREVFGFVFVCLALMDSILAFIFYRQSRRASDGVV